MRFFCHTHFLSAMFLCGLSCIIGYCSKQSVYRLLWMHLDALAFGCTREVASYVRRARMQVSHRVVTCPFLSGFHPAVSARPACLAELTVDLSRASTG